MIKYFSFLFFSIISESVFHSQEITFNFISLNYLGNCLYHGNNSISRKTSHSISMYKDERIIFTVNVGAIYGLGCGDCILIFLSDYEKIYFNKQLTKESTNMNQIENKFIGLVINIIPNSTVFSLNHYKNNNLIKNYYHIQYQIHPCPLLADEFHEFLFCSDFLCHDETKLYENLKFKDYYNLYYVTIHPRNFLFPIVSIKLFYENHDFEYLPLAYEQTGFILPQHIKHDKFYLECLDSGSHTYQFIFDWNEILESNLIINYHGGIILTKKNIL